MNRIIEVINSLIIKAKNQNDLGNVKFLKEFTSCVTSELTGGFVAAVKIEDVNMKDDFAGGYVENQVKGISFEVNFAVEVFSSRDIHGESLSDIALKIMNSIIKADNNKLIYNAVACPIEFNERLNAISRKIKFQMNFCLVGDGNE